MRLSKIGNSILSGARKVWRPFTGLAIFGTVTVQGIVIPLYNILHHITTPYDLKGLSLLITAVAPAFAVREWGKIKGAADDAK